MFQSLYESTHGLTVGAQKSSPRSPNRAWPAMYRGGTVDLDPSQWTLSIDGLVDNPITITYDGLKRYPQVNQFRRIVAAEGWTYRARWEGVLLRDIMKEVRPRPEAQYLRQVNASGHVEYLPVATLIQGNPLLATQEGGHPLNIWYGGPVRLLAFHVFCHKGLGQINRLTFLDSIPSEDKGFWETLGYEPSGTITSGKYYAFDLKSFRPVDGAGEVTNF